MKEILEKKLANEIDMNEADSERGWIYEKVKGGRSWKIENLQRNYIKEACKDFAAKEARGIIIKAINDSFQF